MVPATIAPVVGRQLLNVVTAGMYDNPMMVYREYIQNAVDSIDAAVDEQKVLSREDAVVRITLDGRTRSVCIEDNGCGLDNASAPTVLTSLGSSPKEGSSHRGFRGIGRLGGLAYCDELVFETRTSANERVAVVSWDRRKLEKLTAKREQGVLLTETIKQVVTASFREPQESDKQRFFRVTMVNVHRFHSDSLMNLKTIHGYLSQVAPVPYAPSDFSFANQLTERFSKIPDFRSYSISLNGRPVFRPYADMITITSNRSDRIARPEFFTVSGTDGSPIAEGWYAVTNFTAALPPSSPVRGIRIRSGNIEVGDEHFLGDLYSERRFAGWQVGEIHVMPGALQANARRDGYEATPNFEKFLEQVGLLTRHLSNQCRKHSLARAGKDRLERAIVETEKRLSKAATYIDEQHYAAMVDASKVKLAEVERIFASLEESDPLAKRYVDIRRRLDEMLHNPTYIAQMIDGRRGDKLLLSKVAKVVLTAFPKASTPDEMVRAILEPFLKKGHSTGKS